MQIASKHRWSRPLQASLCNLCRNTWHHHWLKLWLKHSACKLRSRDDIWMILRYEDVHLSFLVFSYCCSFSKLSNDEMRLFLLLCCWISTWVCVLLNSLETNAKKALFLFNQFLKIVMQILFLISYPATIVIGSFKILNLLWSQLTKQK